MTITASTVLKSASGQMLGALAGVLKKGADHAAALRIPENVLLDVRLFPDMFPLSRQVQIACDQVTRGAARLAGMELPSFPDIETSFVQLIDRTRRADAYCQEIAAEVIDRRTEAQITFPVGGGAEMTLTGASFLQTYVLPNLYFHAATAYNILRHNGVALGKRDFLRPPASPPAT